MVKFCTQFFLFLVACRAVSGLKGSPILRRDDFASVSTASTCKATPFDMVAAINFPRYISSSCSADQQWADRVAWAESSLLAHAMTQWKSQGGYQRAIDFYLGPTHLNLSTSEYKSEYLPRLEKIISLQDILYTGEDVGNNSFYVYCGDGDFPASFWDGPGKNCTNNKVDNKQSCCDKASLAYSWIEEGSAMTKFVTVLCPKFFEMTTMSNDLRFLFQHDDQHANPFKLMYNSGSIHFHQSIYWAAAQANLMMHHGDYKVDAVDTLFDVQKGNQTLETYWNAQYAEPWRESAIAMFQMQTFCLADAPHEDFDLTKIYVGGEVLNDGPTLWSFDKLSTPWVGPQDPNDSKSQPNMTAWTKTQPQLADKKNYAAYTASAIPTPSCIGAIQNVPSSLSKVSFDQANDAAAGVCHDLDNKLMSQTNVFNGEVVIPAGSSVASMGVRIMLADKQECAAGFEVDAKTCMDMFHSIINGCIVDKDDEAWGGSVVFGCGIYQFEPWQRPAPTPWVGKW